MVRAKWQFRAHNVGMRVKVGSHIRIVAAGEHRITLGDHVELKGDNHLLFRYEGRVPHLSIGDRTYIQNGATIHIAQDVLIGADCAISWNVEIFSTDYHQIIQQDGSSGPVSAPVVIGNKVLIGSGAKILKGTVIGDNCVVGAGTIVSGHHRANSLIVGSPGKSIKTISGWLL